MTDLEAGDFYELGTARPPLRKGDRGGFRPPAAKLTLAIKMAEGCSLAHDSKKPRFKSGLLAVNY